MVSSIKEREERQRSLSPIWNLSPNMRDCQQEPAGSSRQQSSNTEMMEMLKQMRQEMQEREKELKLQLQLRDEYMDKELRRRDQY